MLSLKEWATMMPPDEFEARAIERRRQTGPRVDWLTVGSALIGAVLWVFVITAVVWGWMA